jgi:RNA polymerase sigma-70 factor (ECF subfamily)
MRISVTLTANKAERKPTQNAEAWFEAAFQSHWNRLHAVLFRMLGDGDEAEDLALETFWQLHHRSPAFENEQELGGWLYRVATNLGLNALRARSRRRRYEEEAARLARQTARGEDPAAALEQAQERQRVRSALARLRPRSAQMLVLRHSGLSYVEIAAALQIAPASVGTLLARAEREFEEMYTKGA